MLVSLWRKLAMQRMLKATGRRTLHLEFLEQRENPAGPIVTPVADPVQPIITNQQRENPAGLFATNVAAGLPPVVSLVDASTKQVVQSITAFEGFTGGVQVAVGDFNGDGTADVAAAPGAGGGSTVKVFSGVDGSLLKTFSSGDGNVGVSVAAADYDRDGVPELVVGGMKGGSPLVQVLKYSDGSVLRSYVPFDSPGGVSVAAGDINGDKIPDTIVGAGPGGASRITVFDGRTDAPIMNFFAFETTFFGGVGVSAADLDADGRTDIVVTAGPGGGPRVTAFSGKTGQYLANFFAADSTGRRGVTATVFDANTDGKLDLVTVAGGASEIKVFDNKGATAVTAKDVTTLSGLPVGILGDTTAPTATLSSDAPTTTGTTPIPFKVVFSEAVNGFTAAGVTVTNGTVADPVRVDPKTYTLAVTPAADGAVNVTVKAGAARDAAGNKTTASLTLTRTLNTSLPTVAITPPAAATNNTRPTLTGTVTGASPTVKVDVGGQSLNAAVTGTTWSITVPTALAAGTYDITATATDSLGRTATATLTGGLVIDTTAPVGTVTSTAPEPTDTTPIPFAVTFTEAVTGFTASDLSLTNGTAGAITASADGTTYTFTVTPSAQGAVSVGVNTGAVTDKAGNTNAAVTAVSRTFSTGSLAVTINTLSTNDNTPTLSGTVAIAATTLSVTVGGQTFAGTISGSTWTATVPAALADGTYDVTANADTGSGQTGRLTRVGALTIDATAPTAVLSTTAPDPTSTSPIPFGVTFSEAVNNFTASDVVVTNGGVTGFTPGADSKTFTFTVVPTATGAVSVTVPAAAGTDAAGNDNAASNAVSVTFNGTVTTPTITSTATNPTTTNPIPFSVTFSGPVTGFVAADVAATNGTVANFVQGATAADYTFNVVPAADGVVSVSIPSAAATDAAGKPTAAAGPVSRTFDSGPPTAAVTTTVGTRTNQNPFPVTVTFSEPVTGFASTDLTVVNGAAGATVTPGADGKSYTLNIAPGAEGSVQITVNAGAANDAVGNPNAASPPLVVVYDLTPPAVPTVTGLAAGSDTGASNSDRITNDSTPTLTGTNESGTTVQVFGDSGSGAALLGSATVTGTSWSFTPTTPLAQGTYAITAKATNTAGNTSAASAPAVNFTLDLSGANPTVLSAAPSFTNAATIPFSATFGEATYGFTSADLVVTNGTVENFPANADGQSSFTFDVRPTGDGPVAVTVRENSTTDAAGNPSLVSNTFARNSDKTPPAVALTSPTTRAVAGTAGDGTGAGVTGVQVSIFDSASQMYWNGSAFAATTETFFAATSLDNFATWSYAFAGPAGTYQARAKATDLATNEGVASGPVVVN